MLAGMCVAVQGNLTGAAQRVLGPPVMVAFSGLTTGTLAVSLVLAKPEFTGRAVGYAVGSDILGAVIVDSVAEAQGRVARAPSLVIATQLLANLLLKALGFFGAGASFSLLKALDLALIVVGGVLMVRY